MRKVTAFVVLGVSLSGCSVIGAVGAAYSPYVGAAAVASDAAGRVITSGFMAAYPYQQSDWQDEQDAKRLLEQSNQ